MLIFGKKQPLVYVVDDNSSYRTIVAGCLQALGIKNYKLFDCGESCFSMNDPKADLIILDYNLGKDKWNGIEFMEEYRRCHKESRFLFMSSHTKLETAVESVRKGAFDYILKSKIGLGRLTKQVEIISMAYERNLKRRFNYNLCVFGLAFASVLTLFLSIIYVSR